LGGSRQSERTSRGSRPSRFAVGYRQLKAAVEKRDLTAEEQTNYKKYFDDAAELKVKIDNEPRQREIDREFTAMDAGDQARARRRRERTRHSRNVARVSRLWLADTYHEVHRKSGKLKLNGLGDKQRKRMEDLEDALNGRGTMSLNRPTKPLRACFVSALMGPRALAAHVRLI
jgi:hypothetical protein